MAVKRKRKASAKQLKALAAGRKKRLSKVSSVKKTVKHRKPAKKAAKKRVSVKRISKLEPLHINISGEKTMKRRRRKSAVKSTSRKRRVTRYSGLPSINKSNIVKPLIEGGVAVGGALLSSIIANKLPATVNPKLKASAPILIGLLLGMTKFARNNAMVKGASEGMIIAGGLSLVRQLFPTAPLLAGENEVGLLDNAYMGHPVQLGYESTGTQPLENVAGDNDNFYYTSANI